MALNVLNDTLTTQQEHHQIPTHKELYAGEYEKCIEQNRSPSDRFAHLLPLWNRIRYK